jgi:hypothetical protein
MLSRNYYSHTSPEGLTRHERAVGQGYRAVLLQESLGMLTFDDFVGPETAALQLFRSQLQDELTSPDLTSAKIFNPLARDIGIGFQGGSFSVQGSENMAYMMTAEFGSSLEHLVSVSLLSLINQLRRDPLVLLGSAGISGQQARDRLGSQSWVLEKGLPPLAWDDGMVGRLESTLALDDPASFAAFLDRSLAGNDAHEMTRSLFSQLLSVEGFLNSCLDPEARSLGIVIADQGLSGCRVRMIADPIGTGLHVVGKAFADDDRNGEFSPNEALTGVMVGLKMPGGPVLGVDYSGVGGHYQLHVPSLGLYQVIVLNNQWEQTQKILISVFDHNEHLNVPATKGQ